MWSSGHFQFHNLPRPPDDCQEFTNVAALLWFVCVELKKKKSVLVPWSGVISSNSRPSKKHFCHRGNVALLNPVYLLLSHVTCGRCFYFSMWDGCTFLATLMQHMHYEKHNCESVSLAKSNTQHKQHWHHNGGGNGQIRSQPHIWLLHRTADRAFGCAKTGHPYVKMISPTNK